MSTDAYLAVFANKKLLPLDMMESYFFDYLKAYAQEVLEATYRLPGVFNSVATVTGPAIGQVSVPGDFEATDGNGHKFVFGSTDARLQTVPFENTIAVAYNIGLRQVELIDELDINPRTGQPEYRRKQESIGTLGTPDVVTDNGTTITLRVDAVTEAGVSHAGRTVRVYLVTPAAVSWANAYEDLVVSWTGSNNEVTTTGLLGQTVGLVSTTLADYVVVELGPVLVRVATEDLKTANGVCFLAEFDGAAGSPVPDMTDQNVLSGSLSDLADITRTDSHGDLKVSVRADASDSKEDQLRAESSAGARMWGVDEAGRHWLPNAADSFALDSATYLASLGLPWREASFAGAINQNAHTLAASMGPMVLDGLAYSSGGGGSVQLTTGSVWVPGTDKVSGGALHIVSPSIVLGDGPRYLYITTWGAGIQSTGTKATAYASGNLVLFYFLMTAGSPVTITDLAFRSADLNRKGVVTVSKGDASSNFTDLQAACDYVAGIQNQSSANWPDVEIWILDDYDIGTSAVSIFGRGGLTIRGMNWRGEATRSRIRYGDANTDDCCFFVSANNVRFVGVRFESFKTVGTDTACVRKGSSVAHTRFDGCRFTSSNGNLAWAVSRGVSGTWLDVRFDDCVFDLDSTVSGNAIVENGGTDWRFNNCEVLGANTITRLASPAGSLLDSVWTGCVFKDLLSSDIRPTTGGPNSRVDFINCTGTIGAIENGTLVGCDFVTQLKPTSASDLISVVGGRLSGVNLISFTVGGAVVKCVNARLIPLAGSSYFIGGGETSFVELHGCDCRGTTANLMSGVAPITLGKIGVAGGCILIGNLFGPYRISTSQNYPFIQINGDETLVKGNAIDGSYYTACVFIDGSQCRVSDNDITNPTSHTSNCAIGIRVDDWGNVVSGNTIHNMGDGTDGGIGVYVNDVRNVVIGNMITSCEGTGIHCTNAANNCSINGNVVIDCGLAAVTNPTIGATSLDGIRLDNADNNVVSNNHIATIVGQGIVASTGTAFCSINGNTIQAITGTNSIDLQTGSNSNVCQLNNTDKGVLDSGTTNLVTGGGNI